MRRGQVFYEYFALGIVIFILLLLIGYKLGNKRFFCYINLEHNLKRSTMLSQIHKTPDPFLHKSRTNSPHGNRVLISTEYFSYYAPVNLNNMVSYLGKNHAQKELLAAIVQITKQLKAHNVKYSEKNLSNFIKSTEDYIKAEKPDIKKAENRLNNNFDKFKTDLSMDKSPIAEESIVLIDKFIMQIKSLD